METKTLTPKAKVKTRSNRTALKDAIVDAIQDKKGEDVVSFDLRKITEAVTDYFVICHATSKVQVKAIAEHVMEKVHKMAGEKPWHSEGFENYEWVLLDYFDVVVHIFLKEKRDFYQLEDLWHDAKKVHHS